MSTVFLLNDQEVSTDESVGMLALDYLRKVEQKTATKEGCKEGDCGACTVLLGELNEAGTVDYQPMTSCLLPLGELDGKHLVTLEGLNLEARQLSPVQAAIVEEGGTQCGYCTPGFVVSMTGFLMDETKTLDLDGLKYAWSGNLCRCTGYRALKDTLPHLKNDLGDTLESCSNRIGSLCSKGALPTYFEQIPDRLKALSKKIEDKAESSQDTGLIIAGGTDLYVQQGESIPDRAVHLLGKTEAANTVKDTGEYWAIGAMMTFEAFAEDPQIQSFLPEIAAYNLKIASWPVRTRSTLGGNIINASPIADMTSLLLALDATLELQLGDQIRKVPLKDFYLGYKQMDKAPDELLTQIFIKKPSSAARIHWEKVSKREGLDIATVNSGAYFELEGDVLKTVHLSMGGVAAIPLYLKATCAYLTGKKLSPDLLGAAIERSQSEFEPIADIRGGVYYKRMLARQFIVAHFTKCFPDVFAVEALLTAN